MIGKKGKPTGSVVDRYRYPAAGDGDRRRRQSSQLRTRTIRRGRRGRPRDSQRSTCRKGPTRAEMHPSAVFAFKSHVSSEAMEEARSRASVRVVAAADGRYGAARALFLRRRRAFARAFRPNRTSEADVGIRGRVIVGELDRDRARDSGAAGRGKDILWCADDLRARAAGEESRHHRDEPQGHPNSSRRRRKGGGRDRAPPCVWLTRPATAPMKTDDTSRVKSLSATTPSATRGIAVRRGQCRRRHGVALGATGIRVGGRRAVRRRGRTDVARQRHRRVAGREQRRAAGRSAAARAAAKGKSSRRRRCVGAGAHARRQPDDFAGPRNLSSGDVAAVAGDL